MTTHPAGQTKPLLVGAPLPKNLVDLAVSAADVRDELTRAQSELLFALARHRKAWAAMRARAEEREAIEERGKVGALPTLESDAIWTHRTSDVKWWCAEVAAQAAAVTALQGILDRQIG